MNFIKVFLLLVFVCNYSLLAQSDTLQYELEDIMVTGTRIEQKLIDIPFSVERVDKTQWQFSRKQGVNDVLQTIPGLFLQSRYGNHDVRISIRGFGSRSNSGIRGVRILLDGIPESEPDGQTRVESLDFTAISRIELVKGNSSSLYTNSPGGVINFMTDKYFPTSFALIDNEIGQFDLRKNGFKVGIFTPKNRFMLTTSYENYRGFRQHSNEYQTRLNSVYEANVTDKSKILVNGYYVNGLIKLPGSLTLEQYQTNDSMANPQDVSRDSKRISKKGRLGITYSIDFGKENFSNKVEVIGYGTIKNLDRTAATYRSIIRYGVGGAFRYVNKLTFGGRKKSKQRTNEFSVGGDFFYQTGPISEFDNLNGQKGDVLENLNDETISNVGFYALDQLSILPQRLSLLVTGRYDRVTYASQNLQGSFQDTSRLFDKFTPKFAINLKLTPKIAFYASFGLGFDSPAFNEMDNYPLTSDGGLHLINPDIMPQKSQNIEAGIKGNLPPVKKKFFTNTFAEITFYHNKIQDVIVPFNVNGDVYFRNAGKSKRTGLEVGFSTEIVKGLTLKSAYTFQNFKYSEYFAGVDTGGILINFDYSRNIEPSNPKHFASVDLSYRYTFKKKYTAFIKGNYQYVDNMFVDDANTAKTEAYNLYNGQLGIDLNFSGFRILAYGGLNNITNKKYVGFININADIDKELIVRRYYESGAPRNFFGGLTLAYLFKR